jgi:hypothetical protein
MQHEGGPERGTTGGVSRIAGAKSAETAAAAAASVVAQKKQYPILDLPALGRLI